jgi:glycosyltransferase involved in cell wall biosynthesis
MRIMLWQELFWPNIGGAEVMATKLLLSLKRSGNECIVVTRQDNPSQAVENEYHGIHVYRFPFWRVMAEGNIEGMLQIRRQIAELKRSFLPEIVHVNSFGPSAFFHMNTMNVDPSPFLVTLHSENNLTDRGFTREFLRSADWVVGCSQTMLDFVAGLAPEIKGRSSVIYNGLAPSELMPEPLPFNPPILLCVGRVVAEKGFDLAISAFAALAGRFPKLRLIIAGDGPALTRLQYHATELEIDDRVEFVGWIAPERVAALINSSTIVLMPSRQEAFPLVALQAGLVARPVVASNTGGLREIIVHGETGLLIASNSTALADGVAHLLDSPEVASRMGQAARNRVRQMFTLERHVEAYESLYREIGTKWRKNFDQKVTQYSSCRGESPPLTIARALT